MAVHDLADIETGGLERVRPQLQIEMLGPFLECAPGPPDVFDDRAHTAVAPTGETLDGGRLRVVPAKGQAPRAADCVSQQPDLALQLLHGVLAEPLKG